MPAGPCSIVVLVALFVTLIPTTIGALLSAIGIAGMDRLVRFNVLAMSGRAVEAAGDVDTLLLDKTGTITLGNRQAAAFLPLAGVGAQELADAAQLASLADETPEGRSIVVLAKEKYQLANATCALFTRLRAVLGPHPDERRRHRRQRGPQGCDRGDPRLCRPRGSAGPALRRYAKYAPSLTRSPRTAARRWRWHATGGCSAWFT